METDTEISNWVHSDGDVGVEEGNKQLTASFCPCFVSHLTRKCNLQ
jgi:hypothetical protein